MGLKQKRKERKYSTAQNDTSDFNPHMNPQTAPPPFPEPTIDPRDVTLSLPKPDAFVKYLTYEVYRSFPQRPLPQCRFLCQQGACQACLDGMKTSKDKANRYLVHHCSRLRALLHIDGFMSFRTVRCERDDGDDVSDTSKSHLPPFCDSVHDPLFHRASTAEQRVLLISARQIRTPLANNQVEDPMTARQIDVQLKYKGRIQEGHKAVGDGVFLLGVDDMIMSPCSSDGHCYQFPRDLVVTLENDNTGSEALAVLYLEDGKIVAEGTVMIKHLIDIAENQQPESQNNANVTDSSEEIDFGQPTELSVTRKSLLGVTKWMELTDREGKAKHLSLRLKLQDEKGTEESQNFPKQAELRIEDTNRSTDSKSAPYRMSKIQAFQYLITCLLQAEKDSSGKLEMKEDGQWLIDAFCKSFAIPVVYQQLLHLDWIFKSHSADVTEHCLRFILAKFTVLQKGNPEAIHFPAEVPRLERSKLENVAPSYRGVCAMIEGLCGKVLENYFRLGVEAEGGVHEINWCSAHTDCPSAALKPTVSLLALLSGSCLINDLGQFYEEKFKAAAMMKYQLIKESCRAEEKTSNRIVNEDAQAASNSADLHQPLNEIFHDSEDIYAVIKRICRALTQDLEKDFSIQASGVLPDSIQLPTITARIYSQELKEYVLQSLEISPPEFPAPNVVDAFLAVGAFEDYMKKKIDSAAASSLAIYPMDIFAHFLDDWIQASLVTLCRASETALVHRHLFDCDEGDGVPILLKNMLQMLQEEIASYQRLIEYWPCFGRCLEKVICDTLRHMMNIISQECKMFRVQNDVVHEFSPLHRNQENGGVWERMTCWEWEGVSRLDSDSSPATDALMTSSQVLLFHSLRRLMVEVPHFEELVIKWTHGTVAAMRIEVDGLLAQEVRSQFTAAIVFSSRKLMYTFFSSCQVDFPRLLMQIDASFQTGASEVDVQECSQLHFNCIQNGLREIHGHTDDRVFVSLTRGLWDCISKELFLVVVDLKEHQDNKAWKSRSHCSILATICNAFFQNFLTDELGSHTLTEPDTMLPIHARKTQEMLDKNTKCLNNAFSVY